MRLLSVGLPVFVSPAVQSAKRYRSVIRGWEPERKIFLVVPGDNEKFPARMMNQEAVFRFLHEGQACAFKSVVIRGAVAETGRFGEIQIAWPESIETVHVRRSPRVSVEYPCTFRWGAGPQHTGIVMDLSEGGCSIEFSLDTPPEAEADLDLTFCLPGELPVNPTATVKSVTRKGDAWRAGCQFREMDDVTAGNIRLTIVESMSATRVKGRVVVVLGENSPEVREAVTLLRNDGIESVVAPSILSIGYLLLSRDVNGLIIFDGAREIATPDLCRLVKGTPRLENLPICVVGFPDDVGFTDCDARYILWTNAQDVATAIVASWSSAAPAGAAG